jgi:glyoxylase-like metal-dependent hydrolase (beta-lactamase superfamily II)
MPVNFTGRGGKLYNYLSGQVTGEIPPGVLAPSLLSKSIAGWKMMTYVEEVAEETYRLATRIPGLPSMFTTYFIKDGSGVMIEPGPAAAIPRIQKAVEELGLGNLEYIIPTHLHLDHAGALGKLVSLFPRARVVVNRQGARHAINPSRLIKSTRMAFGEDFEAAYGAILPVPESQVRIVGDGEMLPAGSRQLMIVHTPGHAPHQIAIFDTRTRGLFCGEALGMVYSDGGGVGNEPERLIDTVIENTKLIGDIILRDLKAGETEEAITGHTGDYIREHFGVTMDEYELVTNVVGYIHYFRKRGLA